MKFGIGKCKMMPMGKINPNYTYIMMGSTLAVTAWERSAKHCDIFLKISAQCSGAATKANKMLGFIKKGILNKTESIIMPHYKNNGASTL